MRVITSTPDLQTACNALSTADFVTVDTEFMREQTYWPKLCLIQMAGPDYECIIDPLADGLDLGPFWQLMQNEDVVKVFHAARQDIEIVFHETGSIPTPVFDTQVAAMVCGFGDSVSYMSLVNQITGTTLDKSSRFTNWSHRPLSDKQLAYALADVTYLRDVYVHLTDEIKRADRASWLAEEMAVLTDRKTYDAAPENAWKRLKNRVKNRRSLGILIEVAAWREMTAQIQNVPRNRILRDDAIYDIANQAPTKVAQLANLRAVGDGITRSPRGAEIVAAVAKGLEKSPDSVPPLRRPTPLTAEETAALELLKVLLKSAAAKHGVAPRIIADASDLEAIARRDDPDIAALNGWRRRLFGEDALRLKRGELALTLKNGDVHVHPISKTGTT